MVSRSLEGLRFDDCDVHHAGLLWHAARFPGNSCCWENYRQDDIAADTGWGKAVWGKFYGQMISGATVFVYDFEGKFEPNPVPDV